MEKQYIISETVVMAITNYLKRRPYDEVEQGMIALRTLPVYQAPELPHPLDPENGEQK